MNTQTYRFEFEPDVAMTDAANALQMALVAIEGVVGRARLLLSVNYDIDDAGHCIEIETDGTIGAVLAQAFTNLLITQFGDEAFQVTRSSAVPAALRTYPA